MIQRRIIVSGIVQGVGFRASVLRRAAAYPEVKGYVRNLPDGRVEAVFAGDENQVSLLVEWCKQGPPRADVSSFSVTEEMPDPRLVGFKVRH